jgi:copper transport protein
LYTWFPAGPQLRFGGLTAGLLLLALTWSWSGHARTLRWPVLGVTLDVIHLVAGAAWLGGLFFMGTVVLKQADATAQTAAARAFSPLASQAVVAVVATGVLQTFRIDRTPGALFSTGHGRLVLLKVVALGLMLFAANINRQRVARGFGVGTTAPSALRNVVRRAMLTEAGVGAVIVAATAALVASNPATG